MFIAYLVVAVLLSLLLLASGSLLLAKEIGIALYFAGAVITHLRAKDLKGTPIPIALTAVSTTPLLLGIASM